MDTKLRVIVVVLSCIMLSCAVFSKHNKDIEKSYNEQLKTIEANTDTLKILLREQGQIIKKFME